MKKLIVRSKDSPLPPQVRTKGHFRKLALEEYVEYRNKMSGNIRSLRSRVPPPPPTQISQPTSICVNFSTPATTSINTSPIKLVNSHLQGLSRQESNILCKKQKKLLIEAPEKIRVASSQPGLLNALSATLIFAQEEAGTAIIVDANGWALTCSHCIGESEAEWRLNKRKWLLSFDDLAVQTECRVWDSRRDLALLKIIAVEICRDTNSGIPQFPFVTLATSPPPQNAQIICIGQPGRDDLESTVSRKTTYDLVEISEGRLQGMVLGVDAQDNHEIGTLKHSAWTYWGHSGAPLLSAEDYQLVGLHSSWDDETAMRHGIPHVAIEQFLKENLPCGRQAGLTDETLTATDGVVAPRQGTFLSPINLD